jgi:hypothetical protein
MSTRLFASCLLTFTLAACNGGGHGGNQAPEEVLGLRGPDQVSLIDSNSGSTAALQLPAGLAGVTGSHYETDATQLWVRDDSMSALDTVNYILSSLRDTHYYDQTNAGVYVALVQQKSNGGDDEGNAGPTYEEWTVDSTRASNRDPQIVRFWIGQNDHGTENTIFGRLTITAQPTRAQPLGAFTLYFKALADGVVSTSTDTMFEGYLRTVARTDGQTELEFWSGHGDPDGTIALGERAQRERVHLIGDPATESGRAYSENVFADNDGGTINRRGGEYQLQFNADYVARRDVGNGNALAVLDRMDFTTRINRYGVYDATTEERVARLSGFPVRTAAGVNGWVGFRGVWFPDGTTLTDGQVMYRQIPGSTTPEAYTLVIANGQLQKSTRSPLTLGDLLNEDLTWFDQGQGQEHRVRFTGADFVSTALRTNGEWQTQTPPVSLASSFTEGQWLGCWSLSRGRVEFAWPAVLTTTTPAIVWATATLTPDSPELVGGNLTLHAYSSMLRANITSLQANFQSGQSPYLSNATSASVGNQTYVFHRDSLLLTLGGDDVTLADGVSITEGPGINGLGCGPMFAVPLTTLSEIADQPVSYTWQIGSKPWNQLRTVRSSGGVFASFDPPIRLTYMHVEPGSPFHGRTFFLEWDGSNLGGIPGEQDENGNYTAAFNIPSGTTLGGGLYKIKQLEGDQRMVEVGDPTTVYAAQGFDLDTPISAPTGAPYQDPAIGDKPTVTDAPRYVGGVLQTAAD